VCLCSKVPDEFAQEIVALESQRLFFSVPRSLALLQDLSRTCTITHNHTHTRSLSLSLSLSHTHTYTAGPFITHARARTHTHTHTHAKQQQQHTIYCTQGRLHAPVLQQHRVLLVSRAPMQARARVRLLAAAFAQPACAHPGDQMGHCVHVQQTRARPATACLQSRSVLTSLWSLETFSTVASWTCMSLRNSSAASLPPPRSTPVSVYASSELPRSQALRARCQRGVRRTASETGSC